MSQLLQSIIDNGTGVGPIYTLTGNSGGAIAPVADNINIVSGIAGLTFDGAGNTLTLNGSVAITIAGDSGSTSGNSFTFTGGTSGAVFTMAAGTMTESFNFLSLPATTSANGQILINSTPFLHGFGINNAFVGGAGNFTLTPAQSHENIGVGLQALGSLTIGSGNVAMGYQSATLLTQGIRNTSIGTSTLASGTTAQANTIVGFEAARLLTIGSGNVAIGVQALELGTTATNNVGVGNGALGQITTGNSNTALGQIAGYALTLADSNNICVGSQGVSGDSNTIRIGTQPAGAAYTKFFAAGINSTTVAGTVYKTVTIDENHQLATSNGNIVKSNDNTTTPVTLVVNQAFAADVTGGVTTCAYTLPATATFGDVIRIAGMLQGWTIAQNANQVIHNGNLSTTVGVGGSLASTHARDSVTLMCVVGGSSTEWTVIASKGNLTTI